jgi:hypothetical protein
MKYLSTLLVLSILISFNAKAQRNYKPGYVVNLKNDTLKGFIDYKEWENNPKVFTFKSNLNQSLPQQFSIANAGAFGVTGAEYYQKFIVSKSTGKISLNKIGVGIDTSTVADTSFLKIIVKGEKVSLYSLTDDIKTRFYVTSTEDKQPRELDYYIYYGIENSDTVRTSYTFRPQLGRLANLYNVSSPKLAEDLKYANYKESDIKSIVELINGESSKNFAPAGVSGLRLFAGAAFRYSQLSTGGVNGFFPDGTSVNNVSPAVSGGVDFLVNKYTKRLIFRTEIELNSSHFNIPPTEINGSGTTATLDFKQYTASLIPQVIYNVYSTDQLRVLLDAGIALNFSSYNKYNYQLNFNNVSTISNPNVPNFLHYWNMYRLGTGVVIGNKLQINATYGLSSPITSNGNYFVDISYYQVGVNYLF